MDDGLALNEEEEEDDVEAPFKAIANGDVDAGVEAAISKIGELWPESVPESPIIIIISCPTAPLSFPRLDDDVVQLLEEDDSVEEMEEEARPGEVRACSLVDLY